jgi:hypothetical protein
LRAQELQLRELQKRRAVEMELERKRWAEEQVIWLA